MHNSHKKCVVSRQHFSEKWGDKSKSTLDKLYQLAERSENLNKDGLSNHIDSQGRLKCLHYRFRFNEVSKIEELKNIEDQRSILTQHRSQSNLQLNTPRYLSIRILVLFYLVKTLRILLELVARRKVPYKQLHTEELNLSPKNCTTVEVVVLRLVVSLFNSLN